jgi:hypothetical protein
MIYSQVEDPRFSFSFAPQPKIFAEFQSIDATNPCFAPNILEKDYELGCGICDNIGPYSRQFQHAKQTKIARTHHKLHPPLHNLPLPTPLPPPIPPYPIRNRNLAQIRRRPIPHRHRTRGIRQTDCALRRADLNQLRAYGVEQGVVGAQ